MLLRILYWFRLPHPNQYIMGGGCAQHFCSMVRRITLDQVLLARQESNQFQPCLQGEVQPWHQVRVPATEHQGRYQEMAS